MNERIKSLVERAEYQAQKQSGSDWEVHVEPSREQIFEKFAELIVKECISKLEEKIYRSIDGDGDEIWADLILKEHFGVEE